MQRWPRRVAVGHQLASCDAAIEARPQLKYLAAKANLWAAIDCLVGAAGFEPATT